MKRNSRTLELVQVSLFASLIIVLAFTPLGYILVPFLLIRATIIHVPVILGSVLLGPKKGALLGTLFALTSLINNTLNPTPTSFVFSPVHAYPISGLPGVFYSLIICFVPRILVGILPYFVFKLLSKLFHKKEKTGQVLALTLAGLVGSLTNTLLVMNFIYFLFAPAYSAAIKVAVDTLYAFIFSVITFNGSIEAVVAAVLTAGVGSALLKLHHTAPPKAK